MPQSAGEPDTMYYFKVLLLLTLTTDVFGYSVRESPQVGIAGGRPVPISDVPYMADLRRDDGVHWCGASIVHERFVLTAAHCVEQNTKYTVAVGTDHLRTGESYEVEKVIPHENFAGNGIDNDICLVKLSKEIVFGPNVTFAGLAATTFEYKPGMMLTAAGWGSTVPRGDLSEVLRQVSLPVMDQRECVNIFGSRVTDNMFCAGERNSGKGICLGDGGGPLMWGNVQVGISAFGAKKCRDYPSVYTKISKYQRWISDTVARNL